MKSLSTCFESILDDDDIFLDPENDKKVIEEWIKNNYRFSSKLTISDDFVVDCNGNVGVYVKSRNIESLTNGLFRWGNVEGNFTCSFTSITSLEGAPEKVGGNFDCSDCAKLKSLEGAPKKTGKDFCCNYCDSLKTLEGSPERVGRNFVCSDCDKLKSLEGAPKEVGNNFHCQECNNLKTLKGAPEKVGNKIFCVNSNNIKITDSDRKKYKIME